MKNMLLKSLVAILFLGNLSHAATEPTLIQSCQFDPDQVEKVSKKYGSTVAPRDLTGFKIYERNNELVSMSTNSFMTTSELFDLGIEQSVVVVELPVRADLVEIFESKADMNFAEYIILSAVKKESTSDNEGAMSSGLHLTQIRSAQLFMMGPMTEKFGVPTVVVARDKDGNPLGSFLGGSLMLGIMRCLN